MVRRQSFEFFYYSHKFLIIASIITASWHYFISFVYLLPCILFYVYDLFLRYKSTYKVLYSNIKIVGDSENNSECVFIHLTIRDKIKTKPGSYFFLQYNDISSFESHPLSLISNKDGDKLVFCAKMYGGDNSWTNRLNKYDIALKDENIFNFKNIYVQGPYNHLTIDYRSNKYKNLIVVASGIGFTTFIEIFEDIKKLKKMKKLNKLEKVILIWVVKHFSSFEPFLNIIQNLDESLFDLRLFSTQKKNEQIYHINFEKPNIPLIIKNIVKDKNVEEVALFGCGTKILHDVLINVSSELNIEISTEINL